MGEGAAMRATVRIELKPGVLDPQGKAIEHALNTLGFHEASSVRQGKLIEMQVDAADADSARARVEAMCRTLLANPVIETYSIDLAP